MLKIIKNPAAAIVACLVLFGGYRANATVVINEIWNGSTIDEWVEFYNNGVSSEDVSGWTFVRRTNAATSDNIVYTFPGTPLSGTTIIPAGAYYAIGDSGTGFTLDGTYTNEISTGNQSMALKDGSGNVVDGIGIGTGALGVGTLFYAEGTVFPLTASTGSDISRIPNGSDTNDNSVDFVRVVSATAKTFKASNGGAPDNPNLLVGAALDFGTIAPTATTTDGLLVQNAPSSTDTLNITSAVISGPDAANFSIVTSPTLPLAANGAAGSTGTFVLQFDPQGTTGSFSADLALSSNDPGDPVTTVTLNGASQAPIPGTPVLIISQIIDGTLGAGGTGSGSQPKGVEISNVGTGSADLSQYNVRAAFNGQPFSTTTQLDAGGGGFLDPGDSLMLLAASNTAAYLAIPGVVNVQSLEGGAANFNGNDAVGLFQNTTLLDSYGVDGVDATTPTLQVWAYTDSYAYRVPNVASGNPVFNPGEWVFAGSDALDGLSAAQYAPILGSGVAGSSPQLGFYPPAAPIVPLNLSTNVNHWSLFE